MNNNYRNIMTYKYVININIRIIINYVLNIYI